jgi:glycyl-tRNA synthetase
LELHPAIAPIKVAVLPLVTNKVEITTAAKSVLRSLQARYHCEYDSSGAIGKRYRRADEIGTPFCVTIDFTTLVDGSVTVRDRNTMQQQRVDMKDLHAFLAREVDGVEY